MFHFFTLAFAIFGEDVHAWKGPSTTFTIDDFVGPVRTGLAKSAGLPYLKGGICEVGGTLLLFDEIGRLHGGAEFRTPPARSGGGVGDAGYRSLDVARCASGRCDFASWACPRDHGEA